MKGYGVLPGLRTTGLRYESGDKLLQLRKIFLQDDLKAVPSCVLKKQTKKERNKRKKAKLMKGSWMFYQLYGWP